MEIFTQSPALDRALVDPANWADEQWVHDQFAWLRKNAPLQQLAPHREHAVHLGGGPRRVQEPADLEARLPLAQHGGQ